MRMKSITIQMIFVAALMLSYMPVRAGDKPLKVYILVGQSNMQGMCKARTLAGMALDPEAKPLYDKLVDQDGKPRVHDKVYIAAFSHPGRTKETSQKHGKLTVGYGAGLNADDFLGPELAFGVTMQELVKEPILIIKASWGGKSLQKDFRPPSASKGKGNAAGGPYYQLMMKHVNTVLSDPGKYCPAYDPKQGYEIAGFVWFQGWNDHNSDGAGKWYPELLCHFIKDVRNDLKAPKMPFVIGVMGMPTKKMHVMRGFRKAMAEPAERPEFKGNVVAVPTAGFWDQKIEELQLRRKLVDDARMDKENKYKELREKIASIRAEHAAYEPRDKKDRYAKHKETQQKILDVIWTKEEQEYLKLNTSNATFHYLGSAKIYSRIGEAFARAIHQIDSE